MRQWWESFLAERKRKAEVRHQQAMDAWNEEARQRRKKILEQEEANGRPEETLRHRRGNSGMWYTFFLFFFLASGLHADLAFDSGPIVAIGSGLVGSPLTASFTAGNGSNLNLVVSTLSVATVTGFVPVSTVTWGALSLGLAKRTQYSTTGGYIDLETWGAKTIVPSTTHTITVTFSGTAVTSYGVIGISDYSGADPFVEFGPNGNDASTTAAGTLSTGMSTAYANSWLLVNSGMYAQISGSITLDSSLTSRWNQGSTLASILQAMGDKPLGSPMVYGATNAYAGNGFVIAAQQQVELVPLQPTATTTNTTVSTPTFSASPTSTGTPTFTVTLTPTPSWTASATVSHTNSPSPTQSWTASATVSHTNSPSPTQSWTASPTPSPTITPNVCGCAAGTVAYWPLDDSYVNVCGGQPIYTNGNVQIPFTLSPPPPTPNNYWQTNFAAFAMNAILSTDNYYGVATNANAYINQSQGALEMYLNPSNADAFGRRFFGIKDSTNQAWLYGYVYNNTINLQSDYAGFIGQTSISTGTLYDYGAAWGSGGVSIWVNGTQVGSTASTLPTGRTFTSCWFGASANQDGGESYLGTIGGIRISNVTRTGFPTTGDNFSGCGTWTTTPSATPTVTPLAGTPTQTVFVTPTPNATAAPQAWATPPFTVVSTPVLVPTTTYEGGSSGCVGEASPPLYFNGEWYMSYSANCFGNETVAFATSPSLNICSYPGCESWTRQGQIVGFGVNGVATGADMSRLMTPDGTTLRCYYRDIATGNMNYISSVNNGVSWSGITTAIPVSAWNPTCVGGTPVSSDRMDMWPTGGSNWEALIESNLNGCSNVTQYFLFLFQSINNAVTFTLQSSAPLVSMLPYSWDYVTNNGVGYTQGPTFSQYALLYDAFYGSGYPTNIFHTKSADLFNWRTDTNPTLSYSSPPQSGFLSGVNQVANPAQYQTNGHYGFFFDVVSNSNSEGVIGQADGALTQANYQAGIVPTYSLTFTPSPSWTASPTVTVTPTFTQTSTAVPTPSSTATPACPVEGGSPYINLKFY